SIPETIISPTFVLVREYGNPIRLVHVDLYRVDTLDELQDMGTQDILNRDVIRVIEWADKFPGLQKWSDYQLHFSILTETIRKVEIYG
ncbi:MAG: tRNA (adenosine(37)-N6)-threonylcarbamoyltransferase complex ATPase subunit type 1 TsaE, partial [Caldisericia bacterium]|nr:tRNA (adenosine(37)-N6)-threonylcarbamoyltransferase complex ATPase subunit type 1 TsaE [Caldisericia bacterium]